MHSIIDFYEKVYAQELSHSKSLHLYSSRVVKRYFLGEKEEILTGEHPYLPISFKDGDEISKSLELKGNEVELTYFSMGRISRFVSLNQYESTRIYPLFKYKATIRLKNEEYYINIDTSSRTVMRNNLSSKVTGTPLFKKINLNPHFDFHSATKLSEIISKVHPTENAEELLLFPKIWSDRKLRGVQKQKFIEGEQYVPLGVLALVEKEKNSFTTQRELSEIAKKNDLSLPLQVLFENHDNEKTEKQGIICEELNSSQQTAVENSNNRIVSVISGPPGTGKSFTIANLAAEKVSKGQSILITSKNKEALDVIEEKIKVKLGIENLCVNPSQDSNLGWMKEYLDFILGRKYTKKGYRFEHIEKAVETYQRMHNAHLNKEKELMAQFQSQKEVYKRINSGLAASTTPLFKQRVFEKRSNISIPLWEHLTNYYAEIEALRKKAISNLQLINTFMLEEGLKQYRKELRQYLSFLRARAQARKEDIAEKLNYTAILKAFPVWLVRANDISRVLPQKKEVFDVLIIDEASQCDIPSLIPLIQRAKKIIVVGDTKQLRHISFVSKAFEEISKKAVHASSRHLCKHRDYSILDLTYENIDPLDSVQLNEHFRSQFPIIAFSNSTFYKNQLDVLTKRPVSIAEHVTFLRANGNYSKGINSEEANRITTAIKAIIKKESDLPKALKTTIGILSPFRKQVDYLFEQIVESFSIQEIKDHQIIVGTAFTFQGNERDTMHISLAVDNDSASGSFTYINRQDVFNVSITRAKNSQLIYYSFEENTLKSQTLLAEFFRFYNKDLVDDLGKASIDEFCLEVGHVLKENDYPFWTNFEISGTHIDILTVVDNRFYGIDLIGAPGEMEDYYSLERYKMIERGKVKLFPLPYAIWLGDKEKSIEAVLNLLKQEPVEIDKPKSIKKEEKTTNTEKEPIHFPSATTLKDTSSILGLEIVPNTKLEKRCIVRFDAIKETALFGSVFLHKETITTGKHRLFIELNTYTSDLNRSVEQLLIQSIIQWCEQDKKINQIYWYLNPLDKLLIDTLTYYQFKADKASWELATNQVSNPLKKRFVKFIER